MYRRILIVTGAVFALALNACRETAEPAPTGFDLDGDGPVREGPYDGRAGQGSFSHNLPPTNPDATPPPDGDGGDDGADDDGGGGNDGGVDGGGDEVGGAATFSAAGPAVSFIAFGDWGTGGDDQQAVAQQIGLWCAVQPCQFVVTLGDNFYSDGVQSTTDDQWQEKYRDIYGPLGLPFYPSLGNHDTNGNIEAQVEYSMIDPTWRMPGTEYTLTVTDETGAPIVDFFIFNSQYPYFQNAAVSWLDDAITASQAPWKILAMHHPIYSNGSHGSDDQGNNEFLLPIICNRIDLVLSGHDHNFSYLRSSEDGCPIEQLIIGTGGAGLRDVEEDPRAVSSGSFHGFGWFQATADTIAFRMVGVDGIVYFATSWEKP